MRRSVCRGKTCYSSLPRIKANKTVNLWSIDDNWLPFLTLSWENMKLFASTLRNLGNMHWSIEPRCLGSRGSWRPLESILLSYLCANLSQQLIWRLCTGRFHIGEHNPPLQWRHNGRDGVSNHQPRDCLLNRLFRLISKKTSKRRVTGLCAENPPVTGEFPTQMASNAESVYIWWRHRVKIIADLS